MDIRLEKYPTPCSYDKKLRLVLDVAVGYLYFIDPEHPLATGAAGRIFHHRHEGSLKIGRWVTPYEVVHHDNEIRTDNVHSNLFVMTSREHALLHHKSALEIIICPVCEKEFMPKSSRQKTCSLRCGTRSTRKFEIEPEVLADLVWSMPTTKVAKMLGVSDVAVARRCKSLGIPKPPRGYWKKKRHGLV